MTSVRTSAFRVRRFITHIATLALAALLPPLTGCDILLDSAIQAFITPFLGEGGRTGFHPPAARPIPTDFVNFETPHVHPLDLTPDGSRLLAVNTPSASLEVLDVTGATPTRVRSIAVGLEPVTVRARTNDEAWVINHVSDSVSIVDLLLGHAVRTLEPGDEPTDVAFAEGKAFVICSQLNQVKVYDLANLDAAPSTLDIVGEDPRAAAVSPDGKSIYVTIFESGNRTSIIPFWLVSKPESPYAGKNPIPDFVTNLRGTTEIVAPQMGVIVRKDPLGKWRDANGVDWSHTVSWDLHDHDLAVINAETLAIEYRTGLMNLNMAMGVRPDGAIGVVGTDATNEIRFEPMLTGKFVHSVLAVAPPDMLTPANIADLNPHLADAYANALPRVSSDLRNLSIADPRGIAWSPDSAIAYVTGMGTNNVIKIDELGNRLNQVDVGEGPTGVVFDTGRNLLYVLSKFSFGVSVINPDAMTELARVSLPDPTPEVIRTGRRFLYDARLTSGLGVTSCGACHVDGRMDQIAWDLGNPTLPVEPFNQNCDSIFAFGDGFKLPCEDFNPVKGPMTTQTLQDIIGTEPLHWRGDKRGIEDFNGAFVGLNGADRELTTDEMAKFKAFLATIKFAGNPFRGRDDSLPAQIGNGDPRRGESLYMNELIDARPAETPLLINPPRLGVDALIGELALVSCNRCHQVPTGSSGKVIPNILLIEPQSMKVPQLRNLYEKTGFSRDRLDNNRGFGFTHDGAFSSVEEFLSIPVFHFGADEMGKQKRRDVVAFTTAFPTGTHPAVGWTITLTPGNAADATVQANLADMMTLADEGHVGLRVRAKPDDAEIQYSYTGGAAFTALDGTGATVPASQLRGPIAAGHEITWMAVPLGMEDRQIDSAP